MSLLKEINLQVNELFGLSKIKADSIKPNSTYKVKDGDYTILYMIGDSTTIRSKPAFSVDIDGVVHIMSADKLAAELSAKKAKKV